MFLGGGGQRQIQILPGDLFSLGFFTHQFLNDNLFSLILGITVQVTNGPFSSWKVLVGFPIPPASQLEEKDQKTEDKQTAKKESEE